MYLVLILFPFYLQVSKVSDVVSVGQVLSLTCIGQDLRGNIKLSLKATLPHAHEKKDLASNHTDPLPSQEVVGWTAVENMPSKDVNAEPSISKDEDNMIEETPGCSTPAVIIRSAAECDAQDVTNDPKKKRPKVAKSSPKLSKPASERQEVKRTSAKKTSGASTTAKKNKKEKADSSNDVLDAIPEQNKSNIMNYSSPLNFRSGSMKLGDVVTAKVYQIRAYGLVLELSDGVRGMHKFAVISYLNSLVSKLICFGICNINLTLLVLFVLLLYEKELLYDYRIHITSLIVRKEIMFPYLQY